MKKDAHYYAVLAFCRACGFKKDCASVVAYASQYVDDARTNLIFLKNPRTDINHEIVNNRPAFLNIATAHSYFRMNTFNYEAMVNNTTAFHFIPGCIGENFAKKLRCKEESPVILNILEDTLHEDNLIKLGIVLHAYADSFTHQGFCGLLSKVNDIRQCQVRCRAYFNVKEGMQYILRQISNYKFEEIFDRIVPAYGHGQALRLPDIPYLQWSYQYDFSDKFNGAYKEVLIDNKERFQRAFIGTKQYLDSFLQRHSQHRDHDMNFDNFELLFKALVLEAGDADREENWRRVMIEQDLFNESDAGILFYDDTQWLKEAFINYDPIRFDRREVQEAELADGFFDSCWYQYCIAVKWYKEMFFEYCSKYGLCISI